MRVTRSRQPSPRATRLGGGARGTDQHPRPSVCATWINRVPHLSAVVALYWLPDFARVDVYDVSGAPGFTGTPLPRTMFDGDECT
jgi:hypothetical protein